MKKLVILALAVLLMLSAASALAEDNIDINTSSAAVRYTGIEFVPENFYVMGMDASKTLYVKFEYTNKTDEPKNFKTDFNVTVTQNGETLEVPTMWNSEADTTAFENYYFGAAQNNTIPVNIAVRLIDFSPITITVATASSDESTIQTLTQDITVPEGTVEMGASPVAPEELAGDWIDIVSGNMLEVSGVNRTKSGASATTFIRYMNVIYGTNGRGVTLYQDGDLITMGNENFRLIQDNDKLYMISLDTDALYMKNEDFYRFEDMQLHNIGDTIKTDEVEFTLKGFDYADSVDAMKIGAGMKKVSEHLMVPENDMIWAHISMNVFNDSVKAFDMRNYEHVRLSVIYRNKFSFMMDSNNWITYGHGGKGRVVWMSSSFGNGTLDLSPLSSEDYDLWIPVPPALRDDTTSEIQVLAWLSSSDGSKLFAYRVQ